jgi:hypothetical protein
MDNITQEHTYDVDGNILFTEHKNDIGILTRKELFYKDIAQDIYYLHDKIIEVKNWIYDAAEDRYKIHGDHIIFNTDGDIYDHRFYKNDDLVKILYEDGILQTEN